MGWSAALGAAGMALACGWGMPSAEAALKVAPSRTTYTADPEQSLVGFYTVENTGEAPLHVIVEPEDWSGGIGGERRPVDWLTVQPKELTLAAGEQGRVRYTIRVPKDASGELRTQVFFTSVEPGEGSSKLRSRLGTIIYITIQGTEQIEAAITAVTAHYQTLTPGATKPDRLSLAVNIRNGGNTHIAPEGTVIITDREGRRVAKFPLRGGWGLLPNEQDIYHAIGEGVYLVPGRYTVRISVMVGGDLRKPVTITKTMDAEVTEGNQLQLFETPPPQPSS